MEFWIVKKKTKQKVYQWKAETIKRHFLKNIMDSFRLEIDVKIKRKKKKAEIENYINEIIEEELKRIFDIAWDMTVDELKEETKKIK